MTEQEIKDLVKNAATDRKTYSVFIDEKDFCTVLLRRLETHTLCGIENYLQLIYRNTESPTFSSVHNTVKFLQEVIRTAKRSK